MDNFVPYVYLDGHRSACLDSDKDGYVEGIKFFFRFAEIAKKKGVKHIVVMIHTERNQQKRINSVSKAILRQAVGIGFEGLNFAFNFYGNLDRYNKSIIKYAVKLGALSKHIGSTTTTIHMMLNYSENWACDNLDKLTDLPEISSVIRFTKGHYSGGWIPLKMQKTTLVYVQNPSVSFLWKNEDISKLIDISFDNWKTISRVVGQSEYSENQKKEIKKQRDDNLFIEYDISSLKQNKTKRIIVFGELGPKICEL